MPEAGTSIELREAAAKRNGIERKYKMTESGGFSSSLPAAESRARAEIAPETSKTAILSATLATLETMLGPEYELSDKVRLGACALGAKVSGLISDAPNVAVFNLTFKTMRPLVAGDDSQRRAALEAVVAGARKPVTIDAKPIPEPT